MWRPTVALVLLLAAALLATPGSPGSAAPAAEPDPEQHRRAVSLRVTVEARGLDHAWDVQPLSGGRLLVTQRDRKRLTLVERDGTKRNVALSHRHRIWASGETGLLGLQLDPGFASNRRIYTCQGWTKLGGGHDVRVIAWRLNAALTRARRVETLVKGLPATTGRHAGCRLLITRNGALLVGTGDAVIGTAPQNLRSLGGKTLRLDRMTGRPWPTNPYAGAAGPKRYVLTHGHRNVQGLAQRADGTLWSVEHGTDRDDEVNLLRGGRDYGWDPAPGYQEYGPMTQYSLPGKQYGARWSSGYPTVATSGASFVRGEEWGGLRGTLAVACLGGQRALFLKFSASGKHRWTRVPDKLKRHGRLRAVTRAPDGSLLITTDNGDGTDRVLRVRPR